MKYLEIFEDFENDAFYNGIEYIEWCELVQRHLNASACDEGIQKGGTSYWTNTS